MLSKICIPLMLISFLLSSCSSMYQQPRHYKPLKKETKLQQYTGVKKKIALLPFFNESPYGGDDLAAMATSEFRMELYRTGEYIFDTQATKTFGDSKEIYSGGGIKLVQLSRSARNAGINFVIFGRIVEARVREKTDEIGFVRKTSSYTESKIEIRIFDVGQNKEIYSNTVSGDATDSAYRMFNTAREEQLSERQQLLRYGVRVAVRRAIPEVLKVTQKMDWTGRVARIIENKIYINAGRVSGINIGDILKVITEGQEIYDPETGALLGKAKGEVKGTIEVIDYYGEDGATCILHSGGSVLEGDFVQLY